MGRAQMNRRWRRRPSAKASPVIVLTPSWRLPEQEEVTYHFGRAHTDGDTLVTSRRQRHQLGDVSNN